MRIFSIIFLSYINVRKAFSSICLNASDAKDVLPRNVIITNPSHTKITPMASPMTPPLILLICFKTGSLLTTLRSIPIINTIMLTIIKHATYTAALKIISAILAVMYELYASAPSSLIGNVLLKRFREWKFINIHKSAAVKKHIMLLKVFICIIIHLGIP